MAAGWRGSRRGIGLGLSGLTLLLAAATVGVPVAQPSGADDGAARSSAALVVTDKGTLSGAVGTRMRSFLGIPYARAPVGGLRWRAPEPHSPWKGIRNATAFRSSCPQSASLFGQQSTDEDCLFLNVFTPLVANGGTRFPVMVWIHGGGLVQGESSDYLPVGLVARKVVVVTVNYRLGVLGFLSHPALSSESPDHASGNYGLLDQQLALKWVRQNIGHFGGDPRNVTLFGESAGGLSVHVQLASPSARGLFQRAIIESGSYAGSQPSLAAAGEAGTAFAARVGCGAQTAACLRRVPVATLLSSQPFFDTTPVLDGHVLVRSITDSFTSGRINRVPVIEGSNHDEFRFFLATDELAGRGPLTASGYKTAIAATLALTPSAARNVAARYPLDSYPSPSIALAAAVTDATFACRARAAVQVLSRYVPTYQYEFNDEHAPRFFPGPPASFPLGAYHAAELPYLFALRGRSSLLVGDHERLANSMLDLWTTFAKTGSPGGDWPRYSPASHETESLAPEQPVVETGFAVDHQCAFWSTAR